MSFLYEFELGKAAEVLANELLKLKQDETVIITADTQSDLRVVQATARAVYAAGAKPMVILSPTPPGVSLAADPALPVAALTGAVKETDVWIDFSKMWLLFTTPYNVAAKENKKLRYMNLTGLDAGGMVNCIGKVDYPNMKIFLENVAALVGRTKHFHLLSQSGTDLEFDNASYPISCDLGYGDHPGTHMMAGMIAWTPDLPTVNGTIVIDASIAPNIGLVTTPVRLEIEKGFIKSFSGGREAAAYEAWMKSYEHPQMFCFAHAGLGFNAGAKLVGNITQDQRSWGCFAWGFGSIGPNLMPPDGIYGPSHTDAVTLNGTVYFDGELLLENGQFVKGELKEMADRLLK